MLRLIPDSLETTASEKVVVFYESPSARDHARRYFAERLAEDPEKNWHWYSAAGLNDLEYAEAATRNASEADLIIFAASAEPDFTPELKACLERSLAERGDREGFVVGLFTGCAPGRVATIKEVYLRQAAHRAGMDYLSHLPANTGRAIPDSLDNFNQRAGQMTSVLDQILQTHSCSCLEVVRR